MVRSRSRAIHAHLILRREPSLSNDRVSTTSCDDTKLQREPVDPSTDNLAKSVRQVLIVADVEKGTSSLQFGRSAICIGILS